MLRVISRTLVGGVLPLYTERCVFDSSSWLGQERHLWLRPYFTQLCTTCPVCLNWMSCEMGGKWPYNCCFVGSHLQDLLKTARCIHVLFATSFFSNCFVRVQVVHAYNRTNTTNIFAQSSGAVEYTDSFSAKSSSPPNECPGYDTKQSDGEVRVILELWGMLGTPSLPSLPGPLWLRVVAPDRILSMGWTELNRVLYARLNCLK